jgi:AcrR family transcriptional regulator
MSVNDGASGDSRRYTDREVALVLRRATEIDERAEVPAGAGVGLSLEELREIAKEVGISAAAIDRAVATLDRPESLLSRFGGAPAVRKAVRVVPRSVDRDGLAALVATVDEHADGTGSVTEALGSVRWTARDRFKSTRVSFTPRDGETAIEVVEKAEPRLRRIFHLLPAAWGAMFAAPVIGALAGNPLAMLGIGVGATAAGLGVGRAAWSLLSASSDRRVRRLAERLAQGSERLGPGGVDL